MRRRYSSEQKQEALVTVDLYDGNVSKAARELGIRESTIREWTKARNNSRKAKTAAAKVDSGLTAKQEDFVDAWIDKRNATEAARKAGYSGNDNALAVQGHENLRNPKIQEKIKERLLSAVSLTGDEVLGTLAEHMRGDITECFNESGYFSLERAKERGVTHLIKKIKYDQWGSISEIEFHNQQSAAIQLSKIFGLEQQPKTNEAEAKAKRTALLNKAAELAQRYGTDKDAALEAMLEARPELRQWLQ